MPTVIRKPGRPRDPDLEAKRRGDILDAAAMIFARDGFAETDVQDIADRCEVSKGTVYRYYETKEELFLAAVDRGLKELCITCDAVINDPTLEPLEIVKKAIHNYLAFFHRRPEMAELFIQERAVFKDRAKPLYFMTTDEQTARDREFVKSLIKAGVFRNVNPDTALTVLSDLLFGTILSNHLAGRRVKPDVQAQAIIDILFQGLLTNQTPRPVKGRSVKTTLKSMAFVVGCLFVMSGCMPSTKESTSQPPEVKSIPVTVQPIVFRNVPRIIQSVGTLHGMEEIAIAPKGEGRIVKINADIGDRIYPGDTLLEIETTDAKLMIQEAQKAMDSELARLGLKQIPDGKFVVDDVPGVKSASVAMDEADRKWKQKKQLLKGGGTSPDEVDFAANELKLAEARKTQAIVEAEAGLSAAKWRKSQLDMAEQRLRDCHVAAPLYDHFWPWAGAVGPAFVPTKFAVSGRMASEGEMIRSNPVTNVYKLVIDHMLKLRTQVSEQFSGLVKVGQSCEVRVDAFPNRVFPGRVARVNPTVDVQNRTFVIEIEVPNLSRELKAGSFAKVSLNARIDENVPTVPSESVVGFAGVTKIFVMENGIAKAIEITPGRRDQNWVEIIGLGQISNETNVLTSGFVQVVNGSKIHRLEETK